MVGVEPLRLMFRAREELWWLRRAVVGVKTPPSHVSNEGGVVVVKMGGVRISGEEGRVVVATPPSRVLSEGGVVVVKMGSGSHFGRGREGGGSMEPLCLVFRAREGFVVCHINPGRT